MKNLYSENFFKNIKEGSKSSADIIFSIIKNYVDLRSIIDIGCGTGSWLASAKNNFSMDCGSIVGIDGEYSKQFHKSSSGEFIYTDLNNPIKLERSARFDLAMSLEVAEHLSESRSSGFVKDLCRLSDIVLFSAAIPGQGGTGHINEQWPEYWQAEFDQNGYQMFDLIRPKVWRDERVGPWYAQNCFLFIEEHSYLARELRPHKLEKGDWRLKFIHPGIFKIAACESAGASRVLRAIPASISASLKNRMK